MLFTPEAVTILAAYRDDRPTKQYAVFARTDYDEEAPVLAVVDVRGCETVIHEVNSRGYEEHCVRIRYSQGSIYSVVARPLDMWPGDFIVQPIIWDRLAWHPEVCSCAA